MIKHEICLLYLIRSMKRMPYEQYVCYGMNNTRSVLEPLIESESMCHIHWMLATKQKDKNNWNPNEEKKTFS